MQPERVGQALSASILRRLAVRASVDPKTIKKVAAGEPVRGLAGERARSVLREAGLLSVHFNA
jgi:hypothetical protein